MKTSYLLRTRDTQAPRSSPVIEPRALSPRRSTHIALAFQPHANSVNAALAQVVNSTH